MTFIIGSVETLQAQIKEIQGRINKIQEGCSHPKEAVEKKHGSNTGNYDPSNDVYWTDYFCHLCKKTWTEEGSH